MKILFTTHHLDDFAGSELYTFDITRSLRSSGHDIFVYSPVLGKVSGKIKDADIEITDDLREFKEIDFDVIYAQHNTTAIIARSVFPKTPMIFCSHSAYHEIEQPPSIDIGIHSYVALHEEIYDNLKDNYHVSDDRIELIRTPINFDKFSYNSVINEKPKKLLVISNHYKDDVKKVIEEACSKEGLKCYHIGLPENPVEDVKKYIDESDIVVTLGRGALESLASGRMVIVFDHFGGDGAVTIKSFDALRAHNFSGRSFGRHYSTDEFVEEVRRLRNADREALSKKVFEEHEIARVSKKLLASLKKAKGTEVRSSILEGHLLNELTFLENMAKNAGRLGKETIEISRIVKLRDNEISGLRKVITTEQDKALLADRELKRKEKELQEIKSKSCVKLIMWFYRKLLSKRNDS
ncbi:hypothetical protein KKC60_04865 [Patescibacteria group bacterium]|nr:hypothetical protein [Patescibacteria group bacterium]